jgi:hypothetical protein
VKAIDSSFREISWKQQQGMLTPKYVTKGNDASFAEYSGCDTMRVFSSEQTWKRSAYISKQLHA